MLCFQYVPDAISAENRFVNKSKLLSLILKFN